MTLPAQRQEANKQHIWQHLSPCSRGRHLHLLWHDEAEASPHLGRLENEARELDAVVLLCLPAYRQDSLCGW
jgi:hypothetical protein